MTPNALTRATSVVRRRIIEWLHIQLSISENEAARWHREDLKKRLKSCGKGVHFHGSIHISGASSVELGDNVHIGDNAFIRGEGGLTIGDNTHISRNLVLYTINHDFHGDRLPYDDTMIMKPVIIGRNVWIGMNVCIVPGTKIGAGAIVGMGTVVFGEVPARSIVGATGWHTIGRRDEAHYHELEAAQAYGGVNGRELPPSLK